MSNTRPPVALSIAGSDPSGGAGIQADLKTFSALRAYGTTVITALTAQSTRGVTGVHTVPSAFIRAQLETLFADVRIDAVKIGMLSDAPTVQTVTRFFADLGQELPPIVLDPVMVSTSGDRLLDDDALASMRELLPYATVITPNLAEAAALLDEAPATSADQMVTQAHALRDSGARRVLLKGGHLDGPDATDVWADADGERRITATRVHTRHTHGTGCSLSSALAALVPQRESWGTTVDDAKTWLTGAIAAAEALQIGRGAGPVHHFHQIWSRS